MAIDYTTTKLTIAELYRITCQDSSIARFTSHDANIIYDGETFQAIPIKRTPVQYHADLQVDKVDISFGLIGIVVGDKSLSIPQVIRRDFLRNAHVEILRVDYIAIGSAIPWVAETVKTLNELVNPTVANNYYYKCTDDGTTGLTEPTWPTIDGETVVDGTVTWTCMKASDLQFDGYVTGAISFNAGIITISVGSLLDRLKDTFPKIAYTETCNHKLYSTYCGLNKATYKESGTVDALSTTQIIYDAIFLFSHRAQGYWLKGELKFTNGNNDGISRSIEVHGDGYVKLMFPFPESLAIGNTFDAWPGCDKTGVTCSTKWLVNNYENSFMFEYIPKPELLY